MGECVRCYRCGVPEPGSVCRACGVAQVGERYGRWNRGRFSLAIAEEQFPQVSLRSGMWYIARAAIRTGLSPNQLAAAMNPRFRGSRWVSLPGHLSVSSFQGALRPRWTDPDHASHRYQCDCDEDLFLHDGETWALSSQWDKQSKDDPVEIGRAFPSLRIVWK